MEATDVKTYGETRVSDLDVVTDTPENIRDIERRTGHLSQAFVLSSVERRV